ncbi:toll/interleukin-1 receptor domain-containing protein [Nonomuraea rubra]|uniref:TIR domain-containing protein n=1 Tax=Nonomuraea rubra TaxID=46180 RepID=A0A7X0P6P8_9ACTN|nr:toll/interleukin-1 receptor domain-containing protein [Nonomuraea rubra]MBB6556308.1 hypothetical protein [Nonomuraea rubra]
MNAKSPSKDISPAAQELFAALRQLHLRAGEPSTRAIAKASDLSHTTVHSALRGPRVPSWPVLAKLVAALDGDEEEWRERWTATRDAGEQSAPLPIPASSLALEVSIFASYARIDDKATHSRISNIVSDIESMLESLTGSTVKVFKDTDSIAPGEDWRDRIRMGLSSSTILLAFISPAYLRSEMCRQEFKEFLGFLGANSETRLIIPLVYSNFERIDAHFDSDDLWMTVKKLQALPLNNMRSTDRGSSEWIQTVEKISYRIEEVLSSVETTENHASRSELISTEEDSGLLELFADMEDSGPQVRTDLERFAEIITEVGESTSNTAPRIASAQTFGAKLAVSSQLADQLNPLSEEAADLSQRLLSTLNRWDVGVRFGIEMVARGKMPIDNENTITFVDSIANLADIGVNSLGQLDVLRTAIESGKGISKPLNRPLAQIQQALLTFAEISAIFQGWKDALNALGDED